MADAWALYDAVVDEWRDVPKVGDSFVRKGGGVTLAGPTGIGGTGDQREVDDWFSSLASGQQSLRLTSRVISVSRIPWAWSPCSCSVVALIAFSAQHHRVIAGGRQCPSRGRTGRCSVLHHQWISQPHLSLRICRFSQSPRLHLHPQRPLSSRPPLALPCRMPPMLYASSVPPCLWRPVKLLMRRSAS